MALVAAIGDGHGFSGGRDLSAWLGLVPPQATTGGEPKLLGITKCGSRYLRKLVIQGAPRPYRHSPDRQRRLAAGCVVAQPCAWQRGRCRAGEQAGADRLGAAAQTVYAAGATAA
jgi:transposase